jgi:hypothetical protein
LDSAPAGHAGGRGFESRPSRQLSQGEKLVERSLDCYLLHVTQCALAALAGFDNKIVRNTSSELLSVDLVSHDWHSLEVHIAKEDRGLLFMLRGNFETSDS